MFPKGFGGCAQTRLGSKPGERRRNHGTLEVKSSLQSLEGVHLALKS